MPVVVVESPAKAKTINKYLGSDYTVLASYGHVRDLPPKDGSVDTDNDFEMKWEVATDSKKHLKAIADALKEDNNLILATDPDREGEAISWHLEEALRKRKVIKKDTPVSRVVFNAITKTAVTEAMKNPRAVDMELVEAYLARRALDYLVGFNLSPVLWRKLPGAKSAGRVQSVCLRLIVEREMEIEAFKPREYWSVKTILKTPRGQEFETSLRVLGGKKLDKFDIDNAAAADLAVHAITSRALSVESVEAKPATRNPGQPQIWFWRTPNHEHRATPVRSGAHYIHADRWHRYGTRGRCRRPRCNHRTIWQRFRAQRGAHLQKQSQKCSRGARMYSPNRHDNFCG